MLNVYEFRHVIPFAIANLPRSQHMHYNHLDLHSKGENAGVVDSKLSCPVYEAHDLSGISFRVILAARRDFFAHNGLRGHDRSVTRSMDWAATTGLSPARLDHLPIRLIPCQASRAMKHRQRAIRIRMDPDRDLHIMEPVSVWWDLQALTLIPHGIVVGDDTLFLDTEHIGEACTNPRDEGSPRVRRRHGKAPVVGREKLLSEILIRCRHVGDPRQRQLFGQSILQGAEDAF